MSVAQVSLALAIHACPENQKSTVEGITRDFSAIKWSKQTLLLENSCAELSGKIPSLTADDLVSSLARVKGIHFEAMLTNGDFGQLVMFVPGLGMYRADTNGAGEILISEDRIRNAMEQSAGNSRELQRLFRVLLGQAWDDVLEPFRAKRYNQNLALMNKAV